jgi:hypothetical protein
MSTPYYGPPQGQWPTQPYYMPPPPPRRRARIWLIGVVTIVVLGIAGGATAWVLLAQNEDIEPAKIRTLTNDFAKAVATGNPQKMAAMMCADEAQPFLDNVEQPDGESEPPADPGFDIGDVKVKGDVAAATLNFKGGGTQQLYFRKENGKWTVCDPAKDQM